MTCSGNPDTEAASVVGGGQCLVGRACSSCARVKAATPSMPACSHVRACSPTRSHVRSSSEESSHVAERSEQSELGALVAPAAAIPLPWRAMRWALSLPVLPPTAAGSAEFVMAPAVVLLAEPLVLGGLVWASASFLFGVLVIFFFFLSVWFSAQPDVRTTSTSSRFSRLGSASCFRNRSCTSTTHTTRAPGMSTRHDLADHARVMTLPTMQATLVQALCHAAEPGLRDGDGDGDEDDDVGMGMGMGTSGWGGDGDGDHDG